eukprot:sb/3476326/
MVLSHYSSHRWFGRLPGMKEIGNHQAPAVALWFGGVLHGYSNWSNISVRKIALETIVSGYSDSNDGGGATEIAVRARSRRIELGQINNLKTRIIIALCFIMLCFPANEYKTITFTDKR